MSESSTLIINTESRFSNFDEVSPASRSMYIRTFGKMDSGALRGAIFTLCSTAIGAGCLALPSIFHKQGIFLAASLLIFACYISYLGIVNISHAAEIFQVYEYSSLVEKVLGPKSKILLDTALLVGQFGTLTGYQIIIGEFVPQVFKSLDIEFDKDMLRYIIMISSNLLIITPLALKKTLTSLRFMSIISMLTIIYIALLIIIEFPYYAKDNVYENNIEWFRFDLSIISSLNVCFYSFSCHINVAQVYDELNNRNLRRMSKVAFRALTAVLLPFILMATFGYLSTLNNTPNLFISREAPRDISNDWLMVTARILMSITLIIAVAINIPSTRIIVIKSLFRVKKNPSTFM
jgi:amino acid permease